jgi:hypothetical protein
MIKTTFAALLLSLAAAGTLQAAEQPAATPFDAARAPHQTCPPSDPLCGNCAMSRMKKC